MLSRTLYKGQSAIEYLTTYGWMLLVIAIVGGAIFTTVQNSSQIQSTSGLANADVRVDEFGVTEGEGLDVELTAATGDQVENANVSLIDADTGDTVYSCSNPTISVAGSETVSIAGVESSQNTNTFEVEITYDSGGLEGLTEEGSVTGRLSLNESIVCSDIDTVSGSGSDSDDGGSTSNSDFQLSIVGDNGSVTEGETLGVDYTVNNNGDASGSQEITLDVNGSQEDVNSSVSLSSGGSSAGTLSWVTESGDAGTGIGYTVSTENDTVSGSVDVNSLTGPTANASDNVSQPETGDSVKFIGSDSTAGSSSGLSYSWDVDGDGGYEYSGSSPNVTHSYGSSGTYSVELNVSDNNGLWDNDSLTVDVQSGTVSRSEAIAAADAWYEPGSSGTWGEQNGNSNYPSSIDPQPGQLIEDYYGNGLNALKIDGDTSYAGDTIYSGSGGADYVSSATVFETDLGGFYGYVFGLRAYTDGYGEYGYNYNCDNSLALGAGYDSNFNCLGGNITNSTVIFETFNRDPVSPESEFVISGDVSGTFTDSYNGGKEGVSIGGFAGASNTIWQGPIAIVESKTLPEDIKEYFNQNY